ncbi:polysaccharide deacetylase family protein [Salinicola endophyticus]|uniref:Polysaccharide deacetylase family protein n=1 Tax=Salinicola endophyticus TaxID=1949083 RepID=A0AB74U6P8_9GAMM
MADQHFSLVLHDIAPETWPDYQGFVEEIDRLSERLGPIPITWLVVPDFHGRGECRHSDELRRVLDSRLARGDELVLHGYFHRDDAPRPRTLHDFYMRRIYTWEGEFYTLDQATAGALLDDGMAQFDACGWPHGGFVAPAWLMSQGTRAALRQRPFTYTSDPQQLYRLPGFDPIKAPSIVWSARSAWRRGMSRVVSAIQQRRFQQAALLRLALHPVDMRYRTSYDYWYRLVEQLMGEGRQAVTKQHWLDHHAPDLAMRKDRSAA